MKKKLVELSLKHDIAELVRIQEIAVMEIRKSGLPQRVIDFQEDVLRVLRVAAKAEVTNPNINLN